MPGHPSILFSGLQLLLLEDKGDPSEVLTVLGLLGDPDVVPDVVEASVCWSP